MKYIATDIDGVITDGRFTIDVNGNETKQICYRDLDSIGIGRKAGYEFIFVTAENGDMPKRLAQRFAVNHLVCGAKDKLGAIKKLCETLNITLDDMVYIGDSTRDVAALQSVKTSFAPLDATPDAISAAKHVSDVKGGYGVLLWAVNFLIQNP